MSFVQRDIRDVAGAGPTLPGMKPVLRPHEMNGRRSTAFPPGQRSHTGCPSWTFPLLRAAAAALIRYRRRLPGPQFTEPVRALTPRSPHGLLTPDRPVDPPPVRRTRFPVCRPFHRARPGRRPYGGENQGDLHGERTGEDGSRQPPSLRRAAPRLLAYAVPRGPPLSPVYGRAAGRRSALRPLTARTESRPLPQLPRTAVPGPLPRGRRLSPAVPAPVVRPPLDRWSTHARDVRAP